MSEFSLSKYLTAFQNSDKRSFPPVQNPSNELNILIDKLAESPDQIDSSEDTLESLIDLCHSFPHLQQNYQAQLSYLITSSFNNLCNDIESNLNHSEINTDLVELLPQWKQHLKEYGYLIHVLLTFMHDDVHIAASQSSNLSRSANGKKKTQNSSVELFKRTCHQIQSICDAILKLFKLNLSKIFQTTPEKDQFVSLFIKPFLVILEVEPMVKVANLKIYLLRILAVAVKNHGQSSHLKNATMSNLTYFLHLSNFSAELLALLANDYNFPQLTEEVLKEISERNFNAKDTTGPKATSNFLIKLSELSPQVMLRQLSLVIKLLNNSSITLRCSVVESCNNIILDLMKSPDTMQHYKQQLMTLIELLQERFQDSNPYVRTKAIQGCTKICELDIKLNKIRVTFTKLAVRSLEDRSSLVRRNAVKLLSMLLLKHPFGNISGNQLILTEWKSYLEEATKRLDKLEDTTPNSENEEESESNNDEVNSNHLKIYENYANKDEESDGTKADQLVKLKLMVTYLEDAVDFIEDFHTAIDLCSNLLSSKNRNEVIDTMDFLVLTDAYSLAPSRNAIKKMLHLVWMKGTTDEGTSISSHLISCYNQLFLVSPDNFNYKQKATYIAKNLIKLTESASLADLASLEQLLGLMYNEKLIDDNVVVVLWAFYNSAINDKQSEVEAVNKDLVCGAIIVLGMLALANHEIALKGFDSLMKIGLSEIGANDLNLCKYSCLALERAVPKKSNSISNTFDESYEKEAVKKLYAVIINYTENHDYYAMSEQAISALFIISQKPDVISTDIIKEKTMMTFGEESNSTKSIQTSRITSLSQLLFIVGQIAIRTLVYLEMCEAEFKKRKIEAETKSNKERAMLNNNKDQTTDDANNEKMKENELAMIGGTNEDDFTDAIQFIKENDLLFGPSSLLGQYYPMVEEIVSNQARFNDQMLQRTATLCLEKLMCVSSKYCEKSLPLLITVMEKSTDPIVRSNAILGLGDMAVCFNNLVDENTDYLYRRLHDESLMVQRTCLMTITFLILAGQVKVKGQLGEMAKCLENSDEGIRDLCRLFFTELATKDNAIYNGFIDIFSNLSSDQDLEKESFKRLIKFLLSFIEKERHQKQLNEKLFSRLVNCTTQDQWDDIAFVLNTIPYKNEKVTEVLQEGFKFMSAKTQ